MINFLRYFLFGTLIICTGILSANTVWLKDLIPVYELKKHIYLLEDSAGILDISAVSSENMQGFTPFDEWDSPLKTNTSYWGKLEIGNQLPDAANYTEWVLSFPTSLTNIWLYQLGSSGDFKVHFSGTHQPLAKKSFAPTSEGNFFKINLLPGQREVIYFRALAEREALPPEFDISLRHLTLFYKILKDEKRDNSMFLGFVLMMLFYNLVMFVFIKDKAYLYYSLYLLSLSVYVAYKNGDLGDVFEPRLFPAHPEYITFAKLSIHCTIAAYLAFIRTFSNLKVLLPKWDKAYRIIIALSILFLLMDIYLMLTSNFSYNISDRATISNTFIFLAAILGLTWPLAKTNDKKSRYIIAGITFLGAGVLMTVIARLQSYEFTLVWFKIGTILDIVAFSIGLAYRQLENEKEKQTARFQSEKNRILKEQEHAEAMRQKEMNALKSRFFTNITHEFRTPLSIIKGMAKEINNDPHTRELISRNADNLLHLINQMLDLAKLESGKLHLKLQRGDVVSYLQYLGESLRPLAKANQVNLEFESRKPLITMNFDEEKLRHIVYNLLSNALKFTPEGGTVSIFVDEVVFENQPALKLTVSDSGIGIPAGELTHIFDRFYQGVQKNEHKNGGTGVGLSLTRELVRLMDGKISVGSKPDEGSAFTVLLPLFPKPGRHLHQIDTAGGSDKLDSLPIIAFPKMHSSPEKEGTPAVLSEELPVLLLIEDHPDVINFLKTLLGDKYQICVASNGRIGVEKAIEVIPDIIICDVMMPEMDGYEVCRLLKSDERTSHIPIILLTAKAMEADRLAGLKAGADAFLTKPFNKEELFVRLDKLVELRRTLQKAYSENQLGGFATSAASKHGDQPSLDDIFIGKVRSFIMDNIEKPDLHIADLCEEMHLSHTQLYRKIKALTGESPTHFIRKIKLQKAVRLLETTDMNIAEVAYQSGFNDPNYFSRIFQQEFDVPPSSLRK